MEISYINKKSVTVILEKSRKMKAFIGRLVYRYNKNIYNIGQKSC